MRPRARRARGALVALSFATAACEAPMSVMHSTPAGTASIPKQWLFPFDPAGGCGLEVSELDVPTGAAWQPLGPGFAEKRFSVVDQVTATMDAESFPAVRLAGGAGAPLWLRNGSAHRNRPDDPLQCAFDPTTEPANPPRAGRVRLVPSAPTCAGLTPILGGPEAVTFEPYTVLAERLYATVDHRAVPGVTLVSDDGRVLTVPRQELDECFGTTTRAATPDADVKAVVGWISEPRPEATPPPSVPLSSMLAVEGVERSSCLTDGAGVAAHEDCRAAAFGVLEEGPGPFGLRRIAFAQRRLIDAVHAVDGKLVAPAQLPLLGVVVRRVRASGAGGQAGNLPGALLAAIARSASNTAVVARRAAFRYGLLRSPASPGAPNAPGPTAYVDLNVSFGVPDLTSGDETVPRSRPASGAVLSPAIASAALLRASSDALRQQALADAPALELLFGGSAPSCSVPGAAPVCDTIAQPVAPLLMAARSARVDKLAREAAEVFASGGPSAPGDDTSTLEGPVLVYRRRATATLDVAISGASGAPALSFALPVSIEARTAAVDAEHGGLVAGRKAQAPTQDEMDRAAADEVLVVLDRILERWARQADSNLPPRVVLPGTRADQAQMARHTAAGKRVRLIADWIEERPDVLTARRALYPISVPPAAAGGSAGCVTFVAAPVDGAENVDLAVRAGETGDAFVQGRDERPDAEASLELCHLSPGKHLVEVTLPGTSAPSPFVFSYFESTAGAVSESEDQSATAGAPPSLER